MHNKAYKVRIGDIDQSKDAVFMIPLGMEGVPVAVVTPECHMNTVVQLAEDIDADVYIIPRSLQGRMRD